MPLVVASTVALSLLAVSAIGCLLLRPASPLARWLAFVVVLGFAVVVTLAPRTEPRVLAPRPESVELAGDVDGVAARTAIMVAASRCGPRAVELALAWQPGFATTIEAPTAALGASAVAPEPLPFAPDDVRLRASSVLAQDRPTLLEVEVPPLATPLPATLVVTQRGREVLREPLTLIGGSQAVPFTPTATGRHELELIVDLGGHRLTARGGFEAAPAEQVLVIEPSGVVAAALRAQGVQVRTASALPDDWSRHRQVVLGQSLPVADQDALVASVLDGAGLFVLAPGFGGEGTPVRALLPVRPLPRQPSDERTERDGAGEQQMPPVEPVIPAATPPVTPDEAPVGDTDGSKPVAPEPVEVDKHTIAMVLVVDRSGSMGTQLVNGQTKMSYAKTSALRTARALGEGDQVGVVTFGDKNFGRIELPLREATDEVAVLAGIEKLAHAREFTFLLSGLRKAHDMLLPAEAAVKHVVVITDGEFDVSESVPLRAEANRMRREGKITVSMISIVDRTTDPQFQIEAELLTRDGGGQFLPIDDPAAVPVLVSAEVTRALSRIGRKPRQPGPDGGEPVAADQPREPEPPDPQPPEPEPEPPPPPDEPPPADRRLPVRAVAESPVLSPDPDEWPMLGAAVATAAPLEASVLLVAGDEGWPLLAYANRGLGRIGAFAADLGGDAGSEFRTAAGFPAWLSQWVAATTPAEPSRQPRELQDGGEVTPPAPLPRHAAWLGAIAGAPAAPVAEPVRPVIGRRVVDQVADAAPLLLLGLLLLALGERLLLWRSLRRGRG